MQIKEILEINPQLKTQKVTDKTLCHKTPYIKVHLYPFWKYMESSCHGFIADYLVRLKPIKIKNVELRLINER